MKPTAATSDEVRALRRTVTMLEDEINILREQLAKVELYVTRHKHTLLTGKTYLKKEAV